MVSVLIVTYNSSNTIEECLISLNNQTIKDFEVILVDNSSTDSTKQLVESIIPKLNFSIKTIYMEKNLGFAKGNNIALENVSKDCKYIALLNPDAFADAFWLERLIKGMDGYTDVGICASKLIIYGTDIIDSAGDGFSISFAKGFKRGEGDNINIYNKKEYIFGACAGAALYRLKMLEQIGFLDGDFFLIHEDTDLNFRAQLSGWKVLFVPNAVVYHKRRSSIGDMSDAAVYYTLRNCEFVRIKNIPLLLFIKHLPCITLGEIADFIYFGIKYRRLTLYFKSKIDMLKMVPEMLRKRSLIMKNKKVSNRYLNDIMTFIWQENFLKNKVKKFLFH